ncbi:ACP S-malonyltransferase [Candidatus Endoriftia persephonae]|jgi:[acyl-carrier-protein] S-malonyltransferase|uniref:Malonyl CoA-acyl carrier protein transacylase n=2 Tax=Gammaproteobacteria TaxID=1236 RepID=G2FIE3_9GAMM|nr:ACP S-malonyltransferase [Candidatus Endoriftia persephone]EGW53414.1 malonyl CoA-acyl carrier protein transacylase [endosymbiont of Tevnia jerichonana (vent Tica)]USF89032.1 ACP S-malonyltransferase [Candidatus Endoriftia persephone]
MSDTNFCIVFPGQGSQSVGMLSALAETHPVVLETFNEASDALGFDLWQLVQQGPKEMLNQTSNTQPAMLAAGVAVWRAWLAEGGPQPVTMAGHSLGEYSALVCADALQFADAVSLVADRGRFMQEAVPEGTGGMAAILGLDDDKVREVCAAAAESEVAEAVNYNSPGQVVIAGSKAAVDRACGLAKEAGAKRALPLPVSVPSHCALMRPAAERLSERLADIAISKPTIPVIHNVDVAESVDADEIRRCLAEQLYSPVRWVETIQSMAAQGASNIIEAGPGKVLTGLNKRIDRKLTGYAVFDSEGLTKALEALQ